LLIEYGLTDKTFFTYSCQSCKKFFPSKFQGPITTCKHCKNKTAAFPSPANGVSTEQLNEIYNLFDLFVQCAICEGFGMPQVEAAACGLQIASVDYSAMTEIAEKLDGFKIPVARLFREMETNADRANPDIEALSNILYDFFIKISDEAKLAKSQIIRQKTIDIYAWDNVYKIWEECFDSIDISKKLPWDHPEISNTNHNVSVPAGLSQREFIEYICTHIIGEPDLLNISNIQMLIRDFCSGLSAANGGVRSLNHQQVITMLETYLTNKINEEKARITPNLLQKEDFLG
jgi:hypothetical protein